MKIKIQATNFNPHFCYKQKMKAKYSFKFNEVEVYLF